MLLLTREVDSKMKYIKGFIPVDFVIDHTDYQWGSAYKSVYEDREINLVPQVISTVPKHDKSMSYKTQNYENFLPIFMAFPGALI